MQLVSVPELIDHMSGISLTVAQERAAAQILRGLQSNLERKLNHFFGVEQVTQTVTTLPEGTAVLSRRPVVSLVSITTGSPPASVAGVIERWQRGVDIGIDNLQVTVTFTGGTPYPPIPENTTENPHPLDDVRLAILEKASQYVQVRHDDAKSVKDLSAEDESPVSPASLRWTEDELMDFDRLRRRVVAL